MSSILRAEESFPVLKLCTGLLNWRNAQRLPYICKKYTANVRHANPHALHRWHLHSFTSSHSPSGYFLSPTYKSYLCMQRSQSPTSKLIVVLPAVCGYTCSRSLLCYAPLTSYTFHLPATLMCQCTIWLLIHTPRSLQSDFWSFTHHRHNGSYW